MAVNPWSASPRRTASPRRVPTGRRRNHGPPARTLCNNKTIQERTNTLQKRTVYSVDILWVREWIQSNVAGISSNSSTNRADAKKWTTVPPPGQQFYQGGKKPTAVWDGPAPAGDPNKPKPGTPYYLKTPEESKFDPSVEQESVALGGGANGYRLPMFGCVPKTRASA